MRLIGLIVGGALAVAVVAEGAYIVHTRRQVERLAGRLEAIGQGGEDPLLGFGTPRAPAAGGDREERESGRPMEPPNRRLPPPRLVVPVAGAQAPAEPPASGDDPLPLPPALDSPQAREQLRRFVVAQLAREEDEDRLREDQRQREREQARRDRMVKELGLSPSESEKFNQILSQTQTARASLRSRIESGEVPRETIAGDLNAIRQDSEQQLRSLLGDDRLKRFEDMRGRGPGPGGDRRGGWGGFRGGARGQPGAGAAGTAPAP